MEFRVLGTLEASEEGRAVRLGGAKQRALLAILLLNANRVVSSDRLIDELWGDRPPETVATALQVYVSKLRKVLPSETLLTRPPGYLLQSEPDQLDLRRFEVLVTGGRQAIADGDPERGARLLHEALGLWRGPALAEFAFEPFAQGEIVRLEELRMAALEERIEADLALGRHAELVGELEALVSESPVRERLRGQLMLALYRSGRQAEALEAYQKARRILVDELGIEPSASLQQLEKAILVQDRELELSAAAVATIESRAPVERRAERRMTTAIFADLGASREAETDPEVAHAFLERVHRAAAEEIEAAGGTVREGIADALLALFGAPAAQDDHAERALDAALSTRDRLRELFGDALQLRLGIESGEVLVGPKHGGGTFVSGSPVTGAARLVRAARPGEILVGERVVAAAHGAFQLEERPIGRLLVRRI